MKSVFAIVLLILSLNLSGCSDAKASGGEGPTPRKLEVSCILKRSEVKWFWGEVCPIDSNGYLSVGNSQSQGHITTGCVTLQNVCTVVSP